MLLSGTLAKAHIIEAVVQTNGYTQQKAHESVEILLEFIKQTLESGEDVLISGFGKFCVKNKEKRRGRNPATGKEIILAPRKVVSFKWSAKLKDNLNPKPVAKAKKRRVTNIKNIEF